MQQNSIASSSPSSDVSALTAHNLNYLNESLSRHARHLRHSQHHRNSKLQQQQQQQQPNNNIPSSTALVIESSSSTNSSPELSPTPMSNLSSVSSMDDFSEVSSLKTIDSLQQHPSTSQLSSSSTSSLSTIVPTIQQQTPRSCSIPPPPLQQQEHHDDIILGTPLLRKKSGELLKSSLKLPDLQRCQSMPNTNKNVRFATNLEKIKLFEKTERPIAVSTENSPIFDNHHHRRHIAASWDLDGSESSSSSDEEESYFMQKLKPWKLVSSNVRSSFNIDRSKTVQLMRIYLNETILKGSIFVKNLSFDKKVGIRISIDNWKSLVIIQSSYKRSVNSQFDEFEFELNISSLNFKFFETSLTMNLCVEYQVCDNTYWDNNNGDNYKIVMEKISTKKSKKKSHHQQQQQEEEEPDYFNAKINNDNNTDDVFNYRLKPKNGNNRYTFNFNNKYTFNDSILSQPNLNLLDFKNKNSSNDTIIMGKKKKNDDPFLSSDISSTASLNTENKRPTLASTVPPSARGDFFRSTPDLSSLRLNSDTTTKTSGINNEDEYHRLIRNYCYAFS